MFRCAPQAGSKCGARFLAQSALLILLACLLSTPLEALAQTLAAAGGDAAIADAWWVKLIGNAPTLAVLTWHIHVTSKERAETLDKIATIVRAKS